MKLAALARRLLAPLRPAPAPADAALPDYEEFRRQRLAARRPAAAAPLPPGLLSVITPAWNTDVAYLRSLAESLLPQLAAHGQEWVLLDNGSSAPQTLEYLRTLDGVRSVRLLRSETNLGIIRGMRRCLEEARGRYIVPVDADDWLYPDSLSLLGRFIEANGFPVALYSDEDKLADASYLQPYFKPDWDPVLFVNSCYIAHLCAFDRRAALELGVYGDPRTEGSPDWDAYMRFYLAGHEPRHLAEVLYSWRLHPGSTSAAIDSKSYIHSSHQALLERFLEARGGGRFELVLSPLFAGTPDRWFRRRRIAPRPMHSVALGREQFAPQASIQSLASPAQAALDAGALLHLAWDKARAATDEWAWEAMGLFELFPDTAMAGGRIRGADGRILAAGYYFGFGGGCGCPDRGRAADDPGYFAQMWKPHSVSAVSPQFAVVDPAFLLTALDALRPHRATIAHAGAWLGACARRAGRRVIYSPFIDAVSESDWDASLSSREDRAFRDAFADLIPETRLLSPRLGLDPRSAYCAVADALRRAQRA